MKRIVSVMLIAAMVVSMAACGNKDNTPTPSSSQPQSSQSSQSSQAESSSTGSSSQSAPVEVKDDFTAMFEVKELSGRAIDLSDFDLTPTAEELEAMKKEPAYGRAIKYFMSDGCTSGPVMADKLGYYKEAGLEAEGFKSSSYTEALGTGAADVAVGHIATMLVPSTNGVDLTFVGGAHIGCKSLYVLADSPYQTTADLKGTKVSTPNGIGASDYNITAMLLEADGIDPLTELELMPVETSACVAAMENGEISAALLGDGFAYNLVKDGKLRCISSLLDEDFQSKPCCVIAMNNTFVKENPVISKKITQCVQKAHTWMRLNSNEATQMLLDEGLNSGEFDKNVILNESLQFGLADDFTEAGLRYTAEKYIKLGIITSMSSADEVMAKAWSPTIK